MIGFRAMAIVQQNGFASWSASRCCALFAVACLLAGCGDGQATTTVQGKLTFKGKPITYGLINFKPTSGGKLLGGGIQPDGTYQYELPPGDYQVRIESGAPATVEGEAATAPATPSGPQVPSKFANYATSGLTATVTADGEQTIDFSLE
jgi:hypothetical protein